MKFQRQAEDYLLVLEKGEELVASIIEFARAQNIQAAWLSGVGAALAAEIGYYNLEQKVYEYRQFSQTLEIVSLNGNLSTYQDQPFVHAHIVLSDQAMKTYGGHLKEVTVGGTCELYLRPLAQPIQRRDDEATGLKLINL